MKIETGDEKKITFFQDLYHEARAACEEFYTDLDRYRAQYKGSTEIDGSDERAKLVRNITYELIESQVTSYIPNPSVSPKMWSERNERNAKSIETLLKNKRNELPFEKYNDIDERYNPIYGGSVWLVEWDESIITHNTVGDVKVTCLSPKHFTGQPNIYDVADMEYCFIEFETTKDDIVRRYGISPEAADETESDESTDDKTATLYVCYYKNDEDKVCEYVWSGDTELLDIDDYYARKRYVCRKCGKRKELCTCENPEYELQSEEYEELDRDIPLSNGGYLPAESEMIRDGQIVTETQTRTVTLPNGNIAMRDMGGIMVPMTEEVRVPKTEPTRIPYYKLTDLPVVIRKNTSQEDSLFGQSDCEFIRPQQQAINKVESRIMEKMMGAGVYPIVPKGFNLDMDNSIFKRVFRAEQSDFNLFGRVDLSVDTSRDVAEAERLYDHAKRILGITDSFQGQHDASAQSGKAKQLQIQQAAGRLDSKRQNKNVTYADIYRLIFRYHLAYADEPRPATYKDHEGKMQNVAFRRHDFIERDETGKYYYNDEYLFSADSSYDLEMQRDMMWQENRLNFKEGAYGDPSLPQTQHIFWLNMESAHYPFAHDNVERLREEIARQAQTEQMQAKIQNMQKEIDTRKEYEDYLKNEISARGAQKGMTENGSI